MTLVPIASAFRWPLALLWWQAQAPEPSTFEKVVSAMTGLASIVIALALIAIAIPLIPAAWNFRKTYARVQQLLDRIQLDIDPIVRHALTIGDNLDYITTSARVDVQQLNQTIAAANQRLNHAAALAEQRLNAFNALLQVVQQEAEELFIGSAATARGVRASATAFRDFQRPPEPASRLGGAAEGASTPKTPPGDP